MNLYEHLFSTRQTADLLGVDPSAITHNQALQKLRIVIDKTVIYDREDIERYIAESADLHQRGQPRKFPK